MLPQLTQQQPGGQDTGGNSNHTWQVTCALQVY